MIISVVRSYHWPPEAIDSLFVDDIDYKGLEFWYNEIKDQIKKKNP